MEKNDAQIYLERMKQLNDARVDMVKRHEKPAVIHAVSAAIRRLRERMESNAGN